METTHERNSPQEKTYGANQFETKRNYKSSYRFYLVVVSHYQPQQIHKNITTKSKKHGPSFIILARARQKSSELFSS